MPPAPTSSKSDFASAAPNWTDETATTTSSVGGIRSARSMAPDRTYEELESIFADVDAPFAFVDLDAMWSNAREMLGRAAGTPIRVASKSVRCRPLLAQILDGDPGFRGLMTFTLPESLWLHAHGFDDLLIAYPTADRGALAELGRARQRAAPDPDGGLGRAPGPDRERRRARRPPCAGVHRPRRELVAARRPAEDRREALADPHAGSGARAGARDRAAAGARAGGPDGLRGAHRRPRRQPARQARAGTRDPRRSSAARPPRSQSAGPRWWPPCARWRRCRS